MTDTPRTDAERLAHELAGNAEYMANNPPATIETDSELRARRVGAPQDGRLRSLAAELCDAAFDYHVHSELYPSVEGVEKTVRLLNARHAVQAELDAGEPSPAHGAAPSVVSVAGGFDRSLADFERSCLVHIEEEQRRPNPDNALIALLCDAVRLTREHGASPPGWKRIGTVVYNHKDETVRFERDGAAPPQEQDQ